MKRIMTNFVVFAVSAIFVFTTATVAGKAGSSSPGEQGRDVILTSKTYLEMSEAERRQYVERWAVETARAMGFSPGEGIPPDAVDRIKFVVDAYASRTSSQKRSSCGFGDNLQAAFERARTNAPLIIASFNKERIEPRIGLYLAMVESAHCPCIQSPTGPLGLYQLIAAEARMFGLNAVEGASTLRPDERCEPNRAATAAARQLKATAQKYGTSDLKLPMAIAAFGDLHAFKVQPDSFWKLVSDGNTFVRFPDESKRLPGLIAAAIIGENPQDFNLNLQPISSYAK